MIANFGPGIAIPLHPFFGSIGIAPRESDGKWNSAPPFVHGGNMDNKELTAGSTVFYPVWAPGALFEAGDGHAGQGNGEVDITAPRNLPHRHLPVHRPQRRSHPAEARMAPAPKPPPPTSPWASTKTSKRPRS